MTVQPENRVTCVTEGAQGAHRRASKTKSQHDWRTRTKAGEAVFPVRAGGSVLNMLCANGWLSQADAADRKKVGAAIASMIAESAKDY
jgi:hypothetical protein